MSYGVGRDSCMRSFLKAVIDYEPLAFARKLGTGILSRSNISAWCDLHTGQLLKVDLSSSVGRSIYIRGVYEPEVERCLRSILRPGDVFIDVGANVGYFSIISSQLVGGSGEVH